MLSAAAVMAPALAAPKSSLEVLLETIKKRDEQPKDAPPALPARPTCRGRLPTTRRPSLPTGVRLENGVAKSAVADTVMADKKPEAEKEIGGQEAKEEVVVKRENPPVSPARAKRNGKPVFTDSLDYVLQKKLRVWCSSTDEKWELGQIQSIAGDDVEILLANGEVLTLLPERLLPANPDILDGVDDLIQMSYLNEPSVLYNLVKRWRAAVLIQKYTRRRLAATVFTDQLKYIVLLQSVMRGCLTRKKYKYLQEERESKVNHNRVKGDARKIISQARICHEMNGDHPCQPVATELQGRVSKAEAALRDKEEENAMLKQQLEQYEKKWSEYEAKMKSMEEAWKKQLSSLQLSLVAAKKSLASDDVATRAAPMHAQYDSEDRLSTGTHTPEGTDRKYQNHNPEAKVAVGKSDRQIDAVNHLAKEFEDRRQVFEDDAGFLGTHTPEGTDMKYQNHNPEAEVAVGKSDRQIDAVNHLAKEFEDRRQVFEDDAGFLIAVKSGQVGSNLNPDVELRKLKDRFATWKKDYKSRLKETKVNLQKVGNHEEKSWKRWWGKKSSK